MYQGQVSHSQILAANQSQTEQYYGSEPHHEGIYGDTHSLMMMIPNQAPTQGLIGQGLAVNNLNNEVASVASNSADSIPTVTANKR